MESVTLVVDAGNLSFACNMTTPLSTSDGTPTQAVLGFFKGLGAACDRFKAQDIYVAWDTGRSSERTELFPGYKANREGKKLDPLYISKLGELKIQTVEIKWLLSALGAKQIVGDNLEGDDAIAMMVEDLGMCHGHTVIVSGDKDFYQLIHRDVSVFNPINNGSKVKHITVDNFSEVTGGLKPSQYLEFKALMGDASDGIPGVKGVGEKTALSVLKRFGSVANFATTIAGGYTPTGLEARILADISGFKTAKKLMDLKNPLKGDGRWCLYAGNCDIASFKRRLEQLEFTTTDEIIAGFSSLESLSDWRRHETNRPKL